MSAEQGSRPKCHCHYHPDLIVVRRGEAARALENLELDEDRLLDNGQLCRYLDGLDHSDIAPIATAIALIRVDGDPHEAASQLAPDIEAAPVHGLGYMGHAGYKGDAFQPSDERHPEVPPVEEGQVIAMVDSGLAPIDDIPVWLRDSVECQRPQDTEVLTQKHPVSHGTFVASVIRRVAPEHRLSLASARPDPGYMKSNETGHTPGAAPQPTDELNVFGAIVRLVERHKQRDEVVALNLSLGAYDCPNGGSFLLAMRVALEYWRENFDGCKIFAAGGNSECAERLYPAAWNDLGIRAVGAATDGGDKVVWRSGAAVPDLGRDWITDWAPGQHIEGLSGVEPDDVIAWSGSSFACAVASAAFSNNVNSTVVGSETWWADQRVDYSDIPGLLL